MKGGKSNGLFRDKSIKKINENYLGGKFDEIKKTNCIGYCFTLLISSAISASAVEKVSTGTVYMGGYELYGSLTVYPIHAEGFTYCEKKDAGKSARTVYAYYNKSGDRETKALVQVAMFIITVLIYL